MSSKIDNNNIDIPNDNNAMDIMNKMLKPEISIENNKEIAKPEVNTTEGTTTPKTSTKEDNVETESSQDKKENAWKVIQQKLNSEKKEKETFKSKYNDLLEKVSKKGFDIEDEEDYESDKESTTPSAKPDKSDDRLAIMEKQLQEITKQNSELAFSKGVDILIDMGETVEDITDFIKSQRKQGMDFVKNPNPELMLQLYKGINFDKLTKKELQKTLKVQKESPSVKLNSQPTIIDKEDPFLKEMLRRAKEDKF